MILERGYKADCESFSVEENRLDVFFYSVADLVEKPALKDVWEVIQLLLTLSHGQAAVERGFSINSSLLEPNLKSHSLVAQRIIYDTMIVTEMPVAKFQVTPELRDLAAWHTEDIRIIFSNRKTNKLIKKRERKEREKKMSWF